LYLVPSDILGPLKDGLHGQQFKDDIDQIVPRSFTSVSGAWFITGKCAQQLTGINGKNSLIFITFVSIFLVKIVAIGITS
jgi:hypothetical protein